MNDNFTKLQWKNIDVDNNGDTRTISFFRFLATTIRINPDAEYFKAFIKILIVGNVWLLVVDWEYKAR